MRGLRQSPASLGSSRDAESRSPAPSSARGAGRLCPGLRRALPGFQATPQSTLRLRCAFSARHRSLGKQRPTCALGTRRSSWDARAVPADRPQTRGTRRDATTPSPFVPRSPSEGEREPPATRALTSTRRDQRPSHSGEAACCCHHEGGAEMAPSTCSHGAAFCGLSVVGRCLQPRAPRARPLLLPRCPGAACLTGAGLRRPGPSPSAGLCSPTALLPPRVCGTLRCFSRRFRRGHGGPARDADP